MSAPAVTDAERAAAGRWLVKHGVEVSALTDLLALRLGFRGGARPPGSWRWIVPAILVVTAANVGYLSLAFLPGVRGEELTSGAYLFFLMIVIQLSLWVRPNRPGSDATWDREVAAANQFYRSAIRLGHVHLCPIPQTSRRPVPADRGWASRRTLDEQRLATYSHAGGVANTIRPRCRGGRTT